MVIYTGEVLGYIRWMVFLQWIIILIDAIGEIELQATESFFTALLMGCGS